MDKLNKVGEYTGEYNNLLNINLPCVPVYVSDGLKTHMQNHNHANCLQYIPNIPDIISNPDYVGKNPKEPNSIELVKTYADNIQIGIKLDTSKSYLYVATLFDIKQAKINRRLHSGRLKAIQNNKTS